MPRPHTEIANAVAKTLAEQVPDIASDGIRAVAGKQEDPLAQAVLNVLAGFVDEHGEESIKEASEAIIGLIDGGDPVKAALALRSDPAALEELLDALQDAEADRRRNAKRWALAVGAFFRSAGELLGRALVGALKG